MPDLLPCSRCRGEFDARQPHTTVVQHTEQHTRFTGPKVLDAVVLAALCPVCAPAVTIELVARPVQLVCPVDGCGHTEVVPGDGDPEEVLIEHAELHSTRDLAHALAAATPWAPVADPAPDTAEEPASA
jgi:hypothetical protein